MRALWGDCASPGQGGLDSEGEYSSKINSLVFFAGFQPTAEPAAIREGKAEREVAMLKED